MKIVNIMLSSQKGGLETVFFDYCTELLNLNHKVTGICINSCPYLDNINENINLIKVKSRSIYSPFAIFRLLSIIKNEKPDLIILYGNRPVKMTVLNPVYKLFKIKSPILSVANNNHPYIKKIKYMAAVSKDIQSNLLSKGVKKCYYIPNITHENSSIVKERGVIPVIGVMGRLHSNKGFDIFLKSLHILKEKNIKFKAVIAGDGPEKDNLLNLANNLNLQDHISFTGWIDKKSDFFNQIDIFCLPSRVEPFGIVLLEAMAYYKPIIATNCQGPKDIFNNNINGIIINKESEGDLSQKIQYLIKNETVSKKIAKDGNLTFKARYTSEKLRSTLERVIEDICNNENN